MRKYKYKSTFHMLKRRIMWWFRMYGTGSEQLTLGEILYYAEKHKDSCLCNYKVQGAESMTEGESYILGVCLEVDCEELWEKYMEGELSMHEAQAYINWVAGVGATFPHTFDEMLEMMSNLLDAE